jgi:prevent-host-death family protein
MKQVSIQDLKPQLSAVVSKAESGETVIITRHGKAVARLGPAADHPHVHRGRLVGEPFPPAIATGLASIALATLDEDRGGR